ncbi:serine dehydratase subunit alpha family protein [Ancylomarina sp. 16SWW S1-10-2]|uniref:L-cysteine desulfidase family protein n=1 Tax=Ancylomarina sp. 16SWW S1-10-2 TaxID=2499681 RepID=UPI0012ADCC21|nr:L-serine ammonia-lyase, iron-sulfur-dependent, subunit alpha [Ancylomarina sp. 16SWW S1-10-2]MRT92969.1 serine dehydratase subunit alpha family protein [Ancylomarina sp. 16SWW S1-10-2]
MKNVYLNKLKKEFVPAAGCTEPASIALAAAKASEILKATPDKVQMKVSGNIFKNVMGVGIPGSTLVGMSIAAALGALGGQSKYGLEIFTHIGETVAEEAKSFVNDGKVEIKMVKDVPKLHVECLSTKGKDTCRVIIQDRHENVVLVEHNGKVIFSKGVDISVDDVDKEEDWSVESIYNFITSVDISELQFLEKGIEMNRKIAEEGLKGSYGLQVGKSMQLNIEKGIISDDIINKSIMMAAAGSDARMAGCSMPVMSNCGSGNQGMSLTLPIMVAAEKLKIDDETKLRALALGLLISIHMKSYVGQLSAICGVLLSTSGAACAITYMMGGELSHLNSTLKNMTGTVTGMICDGANASCALKISASVSAAIQSSLLAINSQSLNNMDGIIDDNVEETIRNIGLLANEGMQIADDVILKTMVGKMDRNC